MQCAHFYIMRVFCSYYRERYVPVYMNSMPKQVQSATTAVLSGLLLLQTQVAQSTAIATGLSGTSVTVDAITSSSGDFSGGALVDAPPSDEGFDDFDEIFFTLEPLVAIDAESFAVDSPATLPLVLAGLMSG